MRFKLLTILFVLSLVAPARAQGPVTLYFPTIMKGACMPTCEDHWKIVVPVGTTNYVLNPSAETTGNFAAAGAATVTRSTTYQKYGLYSYRVQTAANGEGLTLTLSALTNADHYVTLRVRGALPFNWVLGIGTNYSTPLLLESIDNNWSLYGAFIPATEASGHTALHVLQYGTGSGDFYVDGVQVEAHAYYTTYCDGAQEGCKWLGTEHAAISERSAQSRAGGRVRDLADDYSFYVESFSGVGMPPARLSMNDYAILPGSELNAVKTQSRRWVLTGTLFAESEKELYQRRQALAQILDPAAYSGQEVLIRFTGSEVQKEVGGIYEGGLEADLVAFLGNQQRDTLSGEWNQAQVFTEKVAVRFLSPDPYWYEVGESAAALDYSDSATFRIVGARLESTGQWDPLGPPGAPGTALYTSALAIAEDDTYVYFAGNFANFDNQASCDFICRWDKVNSAWSSLGTGTGSIVYALAVGPDGTLYAGGAFVTAGGGAAARVAAWDGAAWTALGAGVDNDVYALAVGLDGTLYAGGIFANAGGGAASRIAAWDGAAWSALGAGVDSDVNALAVGPDGTLYAGGIFANAGGGAAARIAAWDGSAWSALGSGLNNNVNALAVESSSGRLYAGGDFTASGATSLSRIAAWNGTAWSALGSGVNNSVTGIAIGPDGVVYAGGTFTSAGGITLADRIARFNGSSWSHLDVDLPGAAQVNAILASSSDPVISSNYNLWIAFNTSGTGTYAGLTTVTNNGTTSAFPKFIIIVENVTPILESIRNETTGKILLFDYNMNPDPVFLTIDLRPTQKSIIDSYRGSVPDAILADSDFGTWRLNVGDNDVTLYVNTTGATAGTPYVIWRTPYLSLD